MALRTWVARARLDSGAPVEAKLKAQAMDLVDNGTDTPGPLDWVGNEVARGVSLLRRPAVVDVDVLIAEFPEA